MVTVTYVEPLDDHRLHLAFSDGQERDVDISEAMWGTLGEALQDPHFFRQVRVDPEAGTVVWPNGMDLDPDVLHGDYPPAVAGPTDHPAAI